MGWGRTKSLRSSPGTTGVSATYPKRWTGWHQDSTVLIGNPVSSFIDSSQAYNHYGLMTPSANGDSFTQSIYLVAGTYDFYVLGVTTASSAIVDWYLNGSLIASGQDWYSGATVYNVEKKTATISVGINENHTLKAVVNGKNAASTGYDLYFTKFSFRQTVD